MKKVLNKKRKILHPEINLFQFHLTQNNTYQGASDCLSFLVDLAVITFMRLRYFQAQSKTDRVFIILFYVNLIKPWKSDKIEGYRTQERIWQGRGGILFMNSCSQTGTYPAEGTDITVNSAIIRQKILKVTLILDKPINHHICQSSLNNLLKNFPKIRENNATNVKIKAFFYMRFHRFILNVHNMTNVSGKTDFINEKAYHL